MSETRLALFTDTYYPEMNGVAKTLERWIVFLRKQGIECLVFAPSRPWGEKSIESVAERLTSLPLFLYPDCRLALPQMGNVERKLLAFRPTIIHVATPFGTGLSGRHLAIKHGIPLVASHHTHFVRYLPFYNLQWMGKLLWRYLHWFHRPCSRIYVPSQSVLEECRQDGWEGLEIWSRGVDTQLFYPTMDREGLLLRLGIPNTRFIILYAGRIAPEKQTEVAVEAVSRFVDQTNAEALLVIAGDGPATNDIRVLAQRLGVKSRFLGALPQEQLQQWMAASDVLLFPSATETFGNVVLEAMACGLPVLGAAGGAVPDTVSDGLNGLLCTPGDIQAFAGGVERLYKDASLRARLSVAGVQDAQSRSWDEVFKGLQTSMEEAIGALSAT